MCIYGGSRGNWYEERHQIWSECILEKCIRCNICEDKILEEQFKVEWFNPLGIKAHYNCYMKFEPLLNIIKNEINKYNFNCEFLKGKSQNKIIKAVMINVGPESLLSFLEKIGEPAMIKIIEEKGYPLIEKYSIRI